MLLPGYNAPLLGLHKVLAGQTTTRVLGRPVIDLRLCSYSRDSPGSTAPATGHSVLRSTVVRAICAVRTVRTVSAVTIHYILEEEIYI